MTNEDMKHDIRKLEYQIEDLLEQNQAYDKSLKEAIKLINELNQRVVVLEHHNCIYRLSTV